MKTNEAPEKIYRRREGMYIKYSDYKPHTIHFNDPKPVEYTRTDAFIEKACEWLRKNADDYTWYDETEHESGMVDEFIEVFRNYMKGE